MSGNGPLDTFTCGAHPASNAFSRRAWMRATAGAIGWTTAAAHLLASEPARTKQNARAMILIWLDGGPSQLETFDPHPDTSIAAGTRAIETPLRGVQLAEGLERTAEQLARCTLVRNLVSREGDHERGTYAVKTGYRPDPTLVHPTIGAVCCHQMPVAGAEIPRHISILPARWSGNGGYLGREYDAFKTYDPAQPLPDVKSYQPLDRYHDRLADQRVVEQAFSIGRQARAQATMHERRTADARAMMTSEQLAAFETDREPRPVQEAFGDTPFGRGCLAARRLVEVGVRCVEVTLKGWDTHGNNHEGQSIQKQLLDPALAALLANLQARDMLDDTLVVCGGEFGRTPKLNGIEGRDHWPHGFSMLLAGGRLRRGHVRGETDPAGGRLTPEQGTSLGDLHATLLDALGIPPATEIMTPVGRPLKLADGQPIAELLSS